MVSLNELDAKLSLLDQELDSESASEEETTLGKRKLTDKQKDILAKKRRKNQSTLCFKFLTGACRFSDCIFRHVRRLDEEDTAEFLRELRCKPFDAKLAEFAKSQNIPVCKEFNKKGNCKHRQCRFWHLEDARIAKWAGYEFFCDVCRRAFTSQTQVDEHKLGKLHQSNLVR